MNPEQNAKPSDIKIAQALELLNEAAKEKKGEVKALLTERYAHIKQVLSENAGTVVEKAQEFVQEGREKIKETAVAAGQPRGENPVALHGGAGVGGVFWGYLMGGRRK